MPRYSQTRRDELYPLIASLIRAERTHPQAGSISYRIGGARLPVLKDRDKFVFADTTVDAGLVRELATGVRIPTKPAGYSRAKSAMHSNLITATLPI